MSKHISNTNLETILPPLVHLANKPADWDENDPSESGYIANRPFYTGLKKDILIEGTFYITSGYMQISTSVFLEANKTYTVIFNGVTYQCVARSALIEGQTNGIMIGNGMIFGDDNPGNNEPFSCDNYDSGAIYLNVASEGNYTISIIGEVEAIKKIDSKYLPDVNFPEGASIGAKGEGVQSEIFNMYSNVADGDYSHAEGDGTFATNYCAHAEGGNSTSARGTFSHAEGYSTYAYGNLGAHSEGNNTAAIGESSHAEGLSTQAENSASHAEGSSTRAIGYYSHAEGLGTQASGQDSHAEGQNSVASGSNSHAEGLGTYSQANASHSEGYNTYAKKNYTHAEGNGTLASSESQHVQGKFNIEDASGIYAHIVGNGAYNNRSNAHTLDWSGNAWFQGTVEGTALILKSSTSGSTKRFKITVNDSGTISATQI